MKEVRLNRRKNIPVAEIIKLHQEGVSVKSLASMFNVDRGVIKRRIEETGIKVRNRSEAMYSRMSQTSKEERIRLASKAHQTVKEKPAEYFTNILKKSAKTKSKSLSKVGILEQYVIDKLSEYGVAATSQHPFGVYNIDISVGNTAIEIHNSSGIPHNMAPVRKRIVNLLKSGWNVIYVKFRANAVINESAIKDIVAFTYLSSGNEPSTGHYRVIRGTGEPIAIGCYDGNDLSIVKTFN